MIHGSLLTAALVLASALCARAGEPGTAGANFLHIGAGPRATAMGEAHTAVANDAYATYWNPAGLSQMSYSEASLMHNQMALGMAQQYLAYAHPLRPGHAAAGSLTRTTFGDIESYDATGNRRGSVNAGDLSLSLAYGALLNPSGVGRAPEVRVGAGGRWIQEKLAGYSATTIAGDVGVLVGRLDHALGDAARGWRLGLAARNLGPGLKFQAERAPLPRTVAAGAAWEGKPWGDPMTVSFEVKQAVDDGIKPSVGAEYWIRRVLAVRVGYVALQDTGLGIRFGIGARLKRVVIDYSLAGFGAVGDMHRFGFSYRFGGAADIQETGPREFITRGQDYLQQRRYYEAVTQFNKALEVDPGNRAALEYMRRALRAMEKQGEKEAGDAR